MKNSLCLLEDSAIGPFTKFVHNNIQGSLDVLSVLNRQQLHVHVASMVL